jgi:hypothetical protein
LVFKAILKTDNCYPKSKIGKTANNYPFKRVIVPGFKQHYPFNWVKKPGTISGHAGKSLQHYPFKRVMAGYFQDSVAYKSARITVNPKGHEVYSNF